MVSLADTSDKQHMHCDDRRASTAIVEYVRKLGDCKIRILIADLVIEISPLFVNRFKHSKVVLCGNIPPLRDGIIG
eukprot:COSAG05_NODE_4079_length_1683_cov_117.472222_1_plen_76_part_00